MEIIQQLEQGIIQFSNFLWGSPILVVLVGGGTYFLIYSQFIPFRYLKHSIDILRGKYDDPNDPGDISHFEALSSALAATIGMGNISGVAIAIVTGGPGALFWMWVCAFVGMATKFFTCTLAIMYRGQDSEGNPEGGPMYTIVNGLGKSWYPLAAFFCIATLFGAMPLFQANQLTQVFRDVLFIPNGWIAAEAKSTFNLVSGIVLAILVSFVIFGGIKRIANYAAMLVPLMVILYVVSVLFIIAVNYQNIPNAIWIIFYDAFTGKAVLGGSLGMVIIIGVRRAAFSNEAGIGTAPMMHGAAKTQEPVREGLVAMLGPAIDTLVVCSMTALAIIVTDVWKLKDNNGVTLTARAFEHSMPGFGVYVLLVCVFIFAITTLFSYSYYGTKALSFLVGAKYKYLYNYLYIASIVYGAVASIEVAFSIIDAMYALMSIPTVLSALLLSPKVMAEAKRYFSQLQ